MSPAALEVDLSDCSYVPKSVFKQIGFSCPRMIHLNLSMCSQVCEGVGGGFECVREKYEVPRIFFVVISNIYDIMLLFAYIFAHVCSWMV